MYNITTEMAFLVPLKDTTKSRDLYDAVKNTFNQLFLSIWNLSGITTNCAPEMMGKINRGNMLKSFYNLRNVIKSFMDLKFVPELNDEN